MSLFPDIRSLIPQRSPFVMVDSLESAGENTCSTRFMIREQNLMVEEDRFTEAGLVENIAQSAAAHAGYIAVSSNREVQTGFIGAITKLEISALPKTGSFLDTTIKIENQIFDVTLISGQVSCKGVIVAQCEMKIFILTPNNKAS